jgi:hypothetical protein
VIDVTWSQEAGLFERRDRREDTSFKPHLARNSTERNENDIHVIPVGVREGGRQTKNRQIAEHYSNVLIHVSDLR